MSSHVEAQFSSVEKDRIIVEIIAFRRGSHRRGWLTNEEERRGSERRLQYESEIKGTSVGLRVRLEKASEKNFPEVRF